jgi:hypothetical protein
MSFGRKNVTRRRGIKGNVKEKSKKEKKGERK